MLCRIMRATAQRTVPKLGQHQSAVKTEEGNALKVVVAKGAAVKSRKFFDDAEKFAKSEGAFGLAWIKNDGGELKGPIVKFLNDAEKEALNTVAGLEEGDKLRLLSESLSELIYMECIAARRALGAADSADLITRVQEVALRVQDLFGQRDD